MKKKILVILLTVCLITACFMSYKHSASQRVVSVGQGKSESIQNFEELGSIFNFFGEKFSSLTEAEIPSGIRLLSTSDVDLPKATEVSNSEVSPYKSATIEDIGSGTVNVSQEGNSYSAVIERSLTISADENATYYCSIGSITYSSLSSGDHSSGSSSGAIDFNMEIVYMDGNAYVRFTAFEYISKGTTKEFSNNQATVTSSEETIVSIKNANKGKWIKMPLDCCQELLQIDSANKTLFSSMGEFFKMFDELSDGAYGSEWVDLDENDLKKLSSKVDKNNMFLELLDYLSDYSNIGLSFDISAPTKPYVYLFANEDNSKSNSRYYYRVSTGEEIMITNINNTVVTFNPDEVETVITTEEELEQLFNITKIEN